MPLATRRRPTPTRQSDPCPPAAFTLQEESSFRCVALLPLTHFLLVGPHTPSVENDHGETSFSRHWCSVDPWPDSQCWPNSASADSPRLQFAKATRSSSSATRWPSGCSISAIGKLCSTAVSRSSSWSSATSVGRPTSYYPAPLAPDFQNHGHRLRRRKARCGDRGLRIQRVVCRSDGLTKFQSDLDNFIRETTTTSYNGKSPPQLVSALSDRP